MDWDLSYYVYHDLTVLADYWEQGGKFTSDTSSRGQLHPPEDWKVSSHFMIKEMHEPELAEHRGRRCAPNGQHLEFGPPWQSEITF